MSKAGLAVGFSHSAGYRVWVPPALHGQQQEELRPSSVLGLCWAGSCVTFPAFLQSFLCMEFLNL